MVYFKLKQIFNKNCACILSIIRKRVSNLANYIMRYEYGQSQSDVLCGIMLENCWLVVFNDNEFGSFVQFVTSSDINYGCVSKLFQDKNLGDVNHHNRSD